MGIFENAGNDEGSFRGPVGDSDEMTLIRSCLVMCLRRLRGYERQHVLAASGTASMVERQQAEQEAATDRALIELIEGTLRAHPTPLIPDPMAKAQNSG